MTYTLKIEHNAPGFKRITVTLSQRGKGIVFEASGDTVKGCLNKATEWISEQR